jgi:Small subunit of serine palmitoyltransferase-like
MLGAIGRFIRLQYYRYSTVTGLYIMGNIESTVIQLTFFVVVYFLVRYTYTFLVQLCSGLLNASIQ